jgi:predicted P-loop ATPase
VGRLTAKGDEVPDLGRHENTEAILKYLNIECYHSDMTHEAMFRRDGSLLDLDPVLAEVGECARRYAREITERALREHLSIIADKSHKHEFVEWLKTACPDGDLSKWTPDGVDRNEQLLDTLELAEGQDRALIRRLLYFWTLQVAMAVTQPRGQYRGVLTLAGPEYHGKSRWIASLGPAECILTGQPFDPANKDHVRSFAGRTISEMSEVDVTFRKRDMSILKAYLGRDEDVFRKPFGKGDVHWGRRTVAAATVNPDIDGRFLADAGTRWWVISVSRCNADHGIDMRHLWLERIACLKALRDAGYNPFPPDDLMESIVANSERHRTADPIEKAVRAIVVPDESDTMTLAEIAALTKEHLGVTGWSVSDTKQVSRALRRMGVQEKVVRGTHYWCCHQQTGALRLAVDNGAAVVFDDA